MEMVDTIKNQILGILAAAFFVLYIAAPAAAQTASISPCQQALEYKVKVPATGAWNDYTKEFQDQNEENLKNQGVSNPSDRDCIVAEHMEIQRQANALADNNPISKQIKDCMQKWVDDHGAVGKLGAYIARVVNREGVQPPIPPCDCEVNVPGYGKLDFNAADLTPKNFLYCSSGQWYNDDQEHCPDENHIFIKVESQKSADLATHPEEHFAGVVKDTGYDECFFGVTKRVHRKNHSCFAPGTKIMMGDHQYKKIENIQAGEQVWNALLQRPVKLSKIAVGDENTQLLEFSYDGKKMTVTQRHPFLVPASEAGVQNASLSYRPQSGIRIKLASEFSAGDSFLGEDKQPHRIEAIRTLPLDENQEVYNLMVDGEGLDLQLHSVVAEGIVTGDYAVQLDINKNLSN